MTQPREEIVDMGNGNIVLIVRGFITDNERRALVQWHMEMRPFLKLNSRGNERYYQQSQNLPWLPKEYTAIRLRLQAQLDVSDADREPEFGWFLGSIGPGGFVHEHRDRSPIGRRHLRCNLFVQVPEFGGEPVIEGKTPPFEAGMLLCFFPDVLRHKCNPVGGKTRRVVCSFGYLVPSDYELIRRERNWCVRGSSASDPETTRSPVDVSPKGTGDL